MKPPDGVSTQARMNPPVGIAPPSEATTQARMNPPGGAPMTLGDMILIWLQSRLSVPHG